VLARTIRQQRDQGDTNWQRKKDSLFASDMIVYISDSKNSTRELLQLIDSFSKVVRYKIYSNKSVAFLYINEMLRQKLGKQLPSQ
jgi:ribosome biogenesis protein Nip4